MNKLSRAYCILQYSSPRPAGDFIQSSRSTFQRSLERSSASPTRGNVTFTVNDPQIKPVNLTGFIAYPVNLTGLLGLKSWIWQDTGYYFVRELAFRELVYGRSGVPGFSECGPTGIAGIVLCARGFL